MVLVVITGKRGNRVLLVTDKPDVRFEAPVSNHLTLLHLFARLIRRFETTTNARETEHVLLLLLLERVSQIVVGQVEVLLAFDEGRLQFLSIEIFRLVLVLVLVLS